LRRVLSLFFGDISMKWSIAKTTTKNCYKIWLTRGIHANENIIINKIIVKIRLVLVQTLEFAIHLKWF